LRVEASLSGSSSGGVNLAPLAQPIDFPAFGTFPDFSQEFDCFRFQAWLAWVVGWNNHFDLNRHHELVGLNQSRSFNAFTGNSHDLIEKMDRFLVSLASNRNDPLWPKA
jgi:hypothetical protein